MWAKPRESSFSVLSAHLRGRGRGLEIGLTDFGCGPGAASLANPQHWAFYQVVRETGASDGRECAIPRAHMAIGAKRLLPQIQAVADLRQPDHRAPVEYPVGRLDYMQEHAGE